MRTCVLVLVAVMGAVPQAQRQGFPVPRAEVEFRALMPFINGWARENHGDVELFKRWTLPYAPLDLQVLHGAPDEADTLRNYFFGLAGRRGIPDRRCVSPGKELVNW
jgi:hypothetical protein